MRYCKRGHDTEAVGRTRSHNCRACLRAWDRERNARRRADPAYRAAEADYKAHWQMFRGDYLRLQREIAAGIGRYNRLREQMPSEWQARYPELAEGGRDWSGDPRDLAAPPYKYRTDHDGPFLRPPHVTKETVAQKAELPLYRMLRELAGIAP